VAAKKTKKTWGSVTEMMEFFRESGRRGGKIGGSKGGKAAAANLTGKELTARAEKAAAASAKVRSKRAKERKQGEKGLNNRPRKAPNA
jgi:hypothetical protein